MKNEISNEVIRKIYLALQPQRGTEEWYFYAPICECKYMESRRWSAWKPICHSILKPDKCKYYLKTVKGTDYIYSEEHYDVGGWVQKRYRLTEYIAELMEDN